MEGGRLGAFAGGGKGTRYCSGFTDLRSECFFSFSLGTFWRGGSFWISVKYFSPSHPALWIASVLAVCCSLAHRIPPSDSESSTSMFIIIS